MRRLRLTEENRPWWVLATLVGSLGMIFIDQTVVSVALPTLQRDLGLTTVEVHWIVTAYLAAFAACVALGGRLGDVLGQARTFRVGAVLFVAASALCGLAGSSGALIAFRIAQGVGAAIMSPASGALVLNAFRPRERGRAMGIYASLTMAFLAVGPLVGGALTELISWRAVFFVNVPVGLVMLVVAHWTLPADRSRGGSIDWGGVPLLLVGLGTLTVGLLQARRWGWGSPEVLALLAVGALLIAALVAWEWRRADPLVDVRMFAERNFTGDAAAISMVQLAITGVSVFGAIWVQDVLGYGPTAAGLTLVPLMLPMALLAPRTGRLYDRIGPRLPTGLGALAVAVALTWTALALRRQEVLWLVPGYVLMGLGVAFVMPAANTDAMNVAPVAERAEASGLVQTTRQVGATLGIALIGTLIANVQFSDLTTELRARSGREPATAQVEHLERSLGAATVASSPAASARIIQPDLLPDVKADVTRAVSVGIGVAAGLVGLAAFTALALLRRERASDEEAPAPAGAPH